MLIVKTYHSQQSIIEWSMELGIGTTKRDGRPDSKIFVDKIGGSPVQHVNPPGL